jgi:hypothetical protein
LTLPKCLGSHSQKMAIFV